MMLGVSYRIWYATRSDHGLGTGTLSRRITGGRCPLPSRPICNNMSVCNVRTVTLGDESDRADQPH